MHKLDGNGTVLDASMRAFSLTSTPFVKLYQAAYLEWQ